MEYILSEIKKLQKEIERYRSSEFSKIVFLADRVRVFNDANNRNTAFTSTIQVTGVGGLPSNITGILYNLIITSGSAANNAGISIKCPEGAITYQNFLAKIANIGDIWAIPNYVKLGAASGANSGQVVLTIVNGVNPVYSNCSLDVIAYML